MLLEKEAITLKQCLYLLISSNCLLNAKVIIYDRGRPFYCNKDFIRIPLAEGKLGEISNRIELYDRKVINLNISGFFTKKIIIDVI